jgi:uncharacterized protein YbcI
VVRVRAALPAAQHNLAKSGPPELARDLLKQVRRHLVETSRTDLEAAILEATGVKTVSLHYDLSTVTNEEVMTFTLAEAPLHREAKQR